MYIKFVLERDYPLVTGESLCSVFQMCFRSLSSVCQMSFRSVSSVCEFSPSVQGFCCCCCCTWSHSSVILHYLRTCMFKCCLLLFNVLLYILGNPIVDQLHPYGIPNTLMLIFSCFLKGCHFVRLKKYDCQQ